MLKFSKRVILGTVVGSLLLTGSAFAWTAVNKNIPVRFAQIKMIVDGQIIKTSAEPFIYNGNVYAPVATIANALGIGQSWNNAVPGVHFWRSDSPQSIAQSMYITAFEGSRARGGSGYGSIPMYNVVTLETTWTEPGLDTPGTSSIHGVRDYSREKVFSFKDFFKDWNTITSASFISGSARPDLSKGENLTDGSFSLLETLKTGETRISKYILKDDKLTRGYSFKIAHNQGVRPVVTSDGFGYTVEFFKGEEFIGVQNYRPDSQGKWSVQSEIFR